MRDRDREYMCMFMSHSPEAGDVCVSKGRMGVFLLQLPHAGNICLQT